MLGPVQPDEEVPDEEVPDGEVVVEVGPIAHGGHCVARHEGQVLFVRRTAPGERVRARITGEGPGGRFRYADAVEILTPAPGRVPPPCRYAADCGGCDFQHLSPTLQRDLKAAVVREQFARLAGVDVDVTVEPLGESPPGIRWRTRVEFAVDESGRAGLRRHRSHAIVPVTDCLIAAPGILETGVLEGDWSGYAAVDVAAPSLGEPVVTAIPAGPEGRTAGADRRVRERVRWPVPGVPGERAVEHEYAVAARGFWQVHPHAAATFVARVLADLDPRPGERALDMYAGAGLFAAALAERVGPEGQVVAVESDATAAALARTNLEAWRHTVVLTARVDDAFGVARPGRRGPAARRTTRPRRVARAPLMPQTADVVVLDPPRTGAGAGVVRAISALGPRAITYVACDPAALARDTRTFAEAGYALGRLAAYDAFPMTHHLECIATFLPSDGARRVGPRRDGVTRDGATRDGATRDGERIDKTRRSEIS